MKKKKQDEKLKAYQLLLLDDEPMTEEKKIWLGLCNLETAQDRLRKSIFREIGELKKENQALKEQIWNLRAKNSELDLFNDFFVMA